MNLPSTHYGLRGVLRVSVIERGIIVRDYPPVRNLILNQGLDQIASNTIAACFHFAACGTGSTPTEADGGANTISISTGTVTVSTIGFLAGDASDVGKTIKLTGSGNVYLITAAISTTQCSVLPANTEGPDNFVIYNTNQTGLAAESTLPGPTTKRSQTYLTGAPNCQTVTLGSVTTLSRTYDFVAESGPITYNEVGFSPSAAIGSNLFSRVKLPAGVPLTAGQQLRVQYSISVTVAPTTPQTFGASPVIGWPSGTGTFQHIGVPVVAVTTDGNEAFNFTDVTGFYIIGGEPSVSTNYGVVISSVFSAHQAYGTFFQESAGIVAQNLSNSSYVNGTYTRDKFTTFPVGSANATNWRSFELGLFNSGTGAWFIGQRFLFDTNQTKLSTHTLTLGFTNTWGRIL